MARDVTKLPKWAQMELQRLEANVETLRRRLGEGPDGDDASNTARHNGYSNPKTPLGFSPVIEFYLDDETRVDARIEGNKLVVSTLNDAMSVVPQSSNVVRIGKGEYV